MYGAHGQHNVYHSHHGGGAPGMPPAFAPPPKPVGVFWDIENCPIPKGTAASSVVHFIRHSFIVNRLNHREFEFLIACDITKLRKDIPKDIDKAGGVTLAHVSGDSKNAADEKLREVMKRFVDTHAALTPMLILISGDIDFVNDLRGFQTRLGCVIVMLHGPNASPHFKVGWNEVYPFQDFLMRMPQTQPQTQAVTSVGKSVPKGDKSVKNNDAGNSNNCAPQQGQNPQFSKRGPNNPGFVQVMPQNTGFRGPNPAQGFRPQNPNAPIPLRNAARFPNSGFNSTVVQHQQPPQIAHASEEAPVSNRAKKRALAAQALKAGSNSNLAELPSTNSGGSKQKKPPGTGANGSRNPNNTGANSNFNAVPPPLDFSAQGGGGKKKGPKPNVGGLPQNVNVNNKGTSSKGKGVPNDPNSAKPNIILMVSGLPGKMDFRILKDHLQEYASSVSGKVMYVHNGQAFITFKKQGDADRATELFQGREVYGKKLNIQLSKSIPFANPKPGMTGPGTGAGSTHVDTGDSGFVMVDTRAPPMQAAAANSPYDGYHEPLPSSASNSPYDGYHGPLPSSGSNSNLLAQGFVAFATAAMNELSLNQESPEGPQTAGGVKAKKQKTKSDPNCVVQ